MGNCASSNDDYGAVARSAAIDRQIEEDSKIFRKECKILLLGKSLSFKLAVRVRLWEARSPSGAGMSHCSLLFLAFSTPRCRANAGQR